MTKRLTYITIMLISVLLLLNLFWSVDRGGNLNVYLQNEYGEIEEGSYDIEVLVDQKHLMSVSILYDQTVPESLSQWIGPGYHTISVKSKSLGVTYSKTFFLFSTTWVVFEIYQDDVGVRINRWPITLQ